MSNQGSRTGRTSIQLPVGMLNQSGGESSGDSGCDAILRPHCSRTLVPNRAACFGVVVWAECLANAPRGAHLDSRFFTVVVDVEEIAPARHRSLGVQPHTVPHSGKRPMNYR